MTDNPFLALEGPLETKAATTPPETYPCGQCAGTGLYRGARVHQEKAHCFACGGKGFFLKSFGDRQKDKAKREAAKQRKLDRIRSDLNAANPGLVEWMADNAHWCSFASELLTKLNQGHELSERQIEAMNCTRAKVAERKVEKAAAREAQGFVVDLTRVEAMFETATGNGLRKPIFRAAGFALSLAPATGKNAGAIYVKRDGEYIGKIAAGKFSAAFGVGSDQTASAKSALDAICADPMAAAVAYGRSTGTCACCGRTLTDPVSVAAGIGPICAGNWGI